MTDLHSTSWYRVAGLRPRLRGHARILRHDYRGRLTYIVQDGASRRTHRFNEVAYQVIGLLDGQRTLDEVWRAAQLRLGDDAPSQDEVIRLVGQLHMADVLQSETPPDVGELLRRAARQKKQRWQQYLLSPLSMKFPLLDPDRALVRALPLYRGLFTPAAAVAWLLLMTAAAVLAGLHWSELSKDVTDRVLAPNNLAILWLTFPVVKALHELGHAAAVRRWGGEVHELGVMLLVLMPVPYCDASAATGFRSKSARVVVGAAGMMVELAIAALALFVWLAVEPGMLRALCFNVMFIAGVSTVLFNANPLLRYDGYFILADLLEIPNLRLRAQRHLSYLAGRYLLRTAETAPDATAGEKAWFVGWGLLSAVYRVAITVAIVLFIADKYFFVGVLLAVWAGATMFVYPLAKGLASLLSGPRFERVRGRARLGLVAGAVAALLLLFVVPFPSWTHTEGVVWVPENAIARADTDGFVVRVLGTHDAATRQGDPILELAEPLLAARAALLQARLDELEARLQGQQYDERVRAEVTRDEIAAAQAELARARQRADALVVRSPADGRLVLLRPADLPDRFMRRGQEVAYLLDERQLTVRVMVPQQQADMVRSHTRSVRIKLNEHLDEEQPATLLREVPAASDMLPNMALSTEGGGIVPLDPHGARRGARALQTYFQFELSAPPMRNPHLGGRVYVRFEHPPEPIGLQWARAIRQLFLRRFGV